MKRVAISIILLAGTLSGGVIMIRSQVEYASSDGDASMVCGKPVVARCSDCGTAIVNSIEATHA